MAGPYQDGFTPGAPGISWGVNGGGNGNSGSSEKAAREDHIHPLNVNTNYMPIPVGGGIQNIIALSGSGHPGSIGLGTYRTMAYALANHVHAYLFCDYLGREGSTITGPSRDGVAYGSFSISTGQYNQGISAGVNGALGAETSAPDGSVGKALFPARADHSHPLNVPPSGDTTSKTKSIGSENKNGSLQYYARIDHEHMLDIPTKDSISSGLNSGYLTIGGNFVTQDTATWAPNATTKKSVTLNVACRVSSNNVFGGIFFRTLTFNNEGRLVSIGGENSAAFVVTDSAYGES